MNHKQDRVEYVLHVLSEDPVLPCPEFKQALVHTLQAQIAQEPRSPWQNFFQLWGWRLAFGGMTLCILVAALLLRLPQRAILTVQQGTVHVVSAASPLMPWRHAEDRRTVEEARDLSVAEGGKIILAKDSAAVLSLFNDSYVELAAGTHITLTKAQPRSVLQGAVVEMHMQSGALRAQVRALRAASERFEVVMPAARVRVQSTVFRAYVIAPDHNYVAVDEGVATVILNDVTLGYPTVQVPEGYAVHAILGQILRVLPQASPQGAGAHSPSEGGWHDEVAVHEITPSLTPSIMPAPTQAPLSSRETVPATPQSAQPPVPTLPVTSSVTREPTGTPLPSVTSTLELTRSTPQPVTAPVASETPPASSAGTGLRLLPVVMPNPTAAGERLFYKLTVHNRGATEAANVVVTETLPTQVSLVTSTACLSETVGRTVVCRLGRVPAGEQRTLQLEVRVASWVTHSFTHTALVRGTTPDGSLLEDRAVLRSVVSAAADVALTRVAAPTQVRVGQVVTYTLSYVNFGPAVARHMTVTALLPPEVHFGAAVRATHPVALIPPSKTPKPGTVLLGELTGPTWLCSELAPGAWGQIVFTGTVSPAAEGVLPVTFSIDSASFDGNTSNDTRVARMTAVHVADLSITGRDVPAEVVAGAYITYAFRYANAGPMDAAGVVFTHTLPAGARFDGVHPTSSIAPQHITQTGQTLVGLVSHLPAGASGVLVVSATVASDAPSLLQNTMAIHSATWDDNELNNATQARMRVLVPDLDVSSALSPAWVAPGMPVVYTVHVTNTGAVTFAAGAVRIAATLPPGAALFTKSVGVLPTSLGDNQSPLAPGQSFSLTMRMTDLDTLGIYPLHVTAAGWVSGVALSASDIVTLSVQRPNVTIAQHVRYAGHVPQAGDPVTVTVGLANTGPSVLDHLSMRNAYDSAQMALVRVYPLPDLWEDGRLGWSDLTMAAPEGLGRNLGVGDKLTITITFKLLEVTSAYGIPQHNVTVTRLVDVYDNGVSGTVSDRIFLFSHLYLPFVTRR